MRPGTIPLILITERDYWYKCVSDKGLQQEPINIDLFTFNKSVCNTQGHYNQWQVVLALGFSDRPAQAPVPEV